MKALESTMTRASCTALAAATLAIASSSAFAESYCVACFSPDVTYRCIIADTPASAAPDPRNQVQCIKQLAKSGKHARCSVERFSTAGCNGIEQTISPTTAAVPLTQPPVERDDTVTAPAPETETAPPAEKPAQPPGTVEELAKSTVESTKKSIGNVGSTVKETTDKAGEQISGVGDAIGNAAKKSWNCLTSFFNDC